MINLEKKKGQQMMKSSHTLEYTMLLITAVILCCSGFVYDNLYNITSQNPEFYYIFNLFLILFIFLVPFIILIVRRKQTKDTFTKSFIIIYLVVANYLFFILKWIIPGYDIDELSILYILIGEVLLILMAFAVIYFKNKGLRLVLYLIATGFNVFLIYIQLIMIAFRGGGPH